MITEERTRQTTVSFSDAEESLLTTLITSEILDERRYVDGLEKSLSLLGDDNNTADLQEYLKHARGRIAGLEALRKKFWDAE